jgi:phosphate transport system ATP-binding protein
LPDVAIGVNGKKDKIIVKEVSFFYGRNQVLDHINAGFVENTLTAITGPSGQGKSTLLGLFNCLWNDVPGARCNGEIRIRLGDKWVSPLKKDITLPILRRKVAMIFQEPNPLPMSIARNMAFPLKLAGVRNKSIIEEKVQKALAQAFLWEEVKDRMEKSALDLSGGQKQRLCIARALVLEPEVLLCDEPTSSLDPKAAGIIEDLLVRLKTNCTLLVVSHHMDQMRRIADKVMVLQDRGLKPI